MNEKKMAFIICVNNELYYEECCWYLSQLVVPEGFETDIIAVREAESMAEAYNAAMESTDAKYKVYMHQDVFICNKNFITDLIGVFHADSQIGLIGLIGGVGLPENGIIYNSWNCGRTIVCDWSLSVDTCFYQEAPFSYADAVDGMLLATQYDISWREDILKQWDFYDISQSFEFIKAGYRIAIPYQEKAWAIHDCGYSNLHHYDENRKIMFEAYPEFFSGTWENHPFQFSYELQSLTMQLGKEIEKLINLGRYQEAEMVLNSIEENGMDKNVLLLRHMFEIAKMENGSQISPNIFDRGLSTNELVVRYTRIKFFLRRLELGEVSLYEDIAQWISLNEVSCIEIIMGIIYNLIDRNQVLEIFASIYKEMDDFKSATIIDAIGKKVKNQDLDISENDKKYINRKRKEAEYWSNYREDSHRTRWWQSPTVIRHYNKTICGKELDGWNSGPIQLLSEKNLIPDGGFKRAISIGCGSAQKEIRLIKEGVVKYFTCVDIAQGMIDKAKENARKQGVESQMDFICGDVYTMSDKKELYDLVFWDNSLHHMESADNAVRISNELLKPEGLFFCNDYIGNSRFQWTDMQMAIVNGIRLYLTDDYFLSLAGKKYPRYITTPSIEHMMNTDPSEAADSENIIPAVKKYFKNPIIINTGGLVYHLCLEDILQNMPEESEILKHMLEMDKQTINFGLSLYAFIFAQKH